MAKTGGHRNNIDAITERIGAIARVRFSEFEPMTDAKYCAVAHGWRASAAVVFAIIETLAGSGCDNGRLQRTVGTVWKFLKILM